MRPPEPRCYVSVPKLSQEGDVNRGVGVGGYGFKPRWASEKISTQKLQPNP